MLNSLNIALQGFLLTPVAMAVQGLLGGEPIGPQPEQPAAPQRVPSSARRSTSMSKAEFAAMVKRLYGAPQALVLPPSAQEQATRRKMRQRKQHRIAALAAQVLQ